MMGLLEELGKRADRADILQIEYDKLYQLICDLATGAKFARNVTVSPMTKSWVWTPPIPGEGGLPKEILEVLNSRNGQMPEEA